MATNKTKPTDASVEDYIASRANAQQRTDCRALMGLFRKSGRTGEAPFAAFAIRGRELVVYLMPDAAGQKSLLSMLGKHKFGKSCLYFKQLADLDRSVLEKLVVGSVAEVKRRYSTASDSSRSLPEMSK